MEKKANPLASIIVTLGVTLLCGLAYILNGKGKEETNADEEE
jgi:hypothetical protein